jgi:hypothetical protein
MLPETAQYSTVRVIDVAYEVRTTIGLPGLSVQQFHGNPSLWRAVSSALVNLTGLPDVNVTVRGLNLALVLAPPPPPSPRTSHPGEAEPQRDIERSCLAERAEPHSRQSNRAGEIERER